MKRKLLIITGLFWCTTSWAQPLTMEYKQTKKQTSAPFQKGAVFLHWGWNRAFYTPSSITLKGDDYDLTLYAVKAGDRPTTPVNADNYLRVDQLTVPQCNFQLGYFLKDNLSLSFRVDHMKYVVNNHQSVQAKGYIEREGNYKGLYNHSTTLDRDFLLFEHTDGLNCLALELQKHNGLFKNKTGSFFLSLFYGGGAGAIMPKSNVRFLNYERSDRYNLAGFSVNATGGVQVVLFKHLQLRLEEKLGYINMPNIALHEKGRKGKGKQQFLFAETIGLIGVVYPLKKRVNRLSPKINQHNICFRLNEISE